MGIRVEGGQRAMGEHASVHTEALLPIAYRLTAKLHD